MATVRQSALNIVQILDDSAAELQIIQNKIIENIQKGAVSVFLKNTDLSGDPASGSVEAKRFKNSASQEYGTARAAKAGNKVKEDKVVIYLNQDREIVEEFEYKDIVAYGIPALMERRIRNHASSMIRELDRAFFLEAWNEGTAFTTVLTDVRKKLEALIVSVETTQNNFVDGVDRELIALTLSVGTHSLLRDEIDELPVAHMQTNEGAIGMWHGVAVYTSNRMPEGVLAMAMVYGSVGQPVLFTNFKVDELELSVAYAAGLYYTYGTKAVMPDLIKYLGDEPDAGEGEAEAEAEGEAEGV